MQATLSICIQLIMVLLEIRNQICTVALSFRGITDGIDFEANVSQTKIIPEPLAQQNKFSINIRSRKAYCLGTYLMKLAIATLLRTLMSEHGACVP
jgi:hypothetical protein